MGLDIYLKWDNQTKDEHDKQITGFSNAGEFGYLRSSYNDGGFNSWANRMIGGKDLYFIFAPPEDIDSDGFKPDWDACLERAKEALAEAEKVKDLPASTTISLMYEFATTRENAMTAFLERSKGHNPKSNMDWFSCREGEFFLTSPPKVLAIIPIKDRFGIGMSKTAMLIYKPQKGGAHDYYIDFLKTHVMGFIKLGKEKDGTIEWSG